MKIIKIFFSSFLCFMFSLFIVIPELLLEEAELYKSFETFEDSKIVEVPMFFRANKNYLVIHTKEGNKYEVGRTYSKYFSKLNDESNIGKKITLYTLNKDNKYPRKIEINDNVIYDINAGNFWYYFILIATPILFYLSLGKYRKLKQQKTSS